MDNQQPTTSPSSPDKIRFDKKFTEDINIYINDCKQKNTQPTVVEFAQTIGVDEQTIFAWASKKRKDEQGNITEDLARPKFADAVKRLSEQKTPEQPKTEEIKETPKKQDAKPVEKQAIGEGDDVKDVEKKEEKLNAKQELFCKLYATDREFFGNGVQTYIEVYEPDQSKKGWYQSACASASQILSNIKVINRINELLEDGGLNDVNVDKQLMFLVNQFADFGAKAAAIREYNKLKSRITDKIDHTTKGEKLPTPILAGGANVPVNNGN